MADTPRKDIGHINRVRKFNNDIIKEKLGYYLKHRNYLIFERYKKSDLILSQAKKQYILSKMTDNDMSKTNSFKYSSAISYKNNFAIVDLQFSKFIKFIEEQVDNIKFELEKLLGPIICHLYIELIKSREWNTATDFLKKYACLVSCVENYDFNFSNNINKLSLSTEPPFTSLSSHIRSSSENSEMREYFKSLIKALSTCARIENIEKNETLLHFRSSKYELDLSFNALTILKQFLESKAHVMILNILQSWINIEVTEFKENEKLEDAEFYKKSSNFDNMQKSERQNYQILKEGKNECFDEKISKKNLSIYLRRISVSGLKLKNIDTPIRIFSIPDKRDKLNCSSLDSNECHIAAGFENSIIKIWKVNQGKCYIKNVFTNNFSNNCSWNKDFEDSSDNFYQNNLRNKNACNQSRITYDNLNLRGHSSGVTDILFLKANSSMLSTSKDKTMRFWKYSDKEIINVKYVGHNQPIWCVSESPLQTYISTGSRDLTAKLWCLNRKYPLHTFVGHTEDVETISFHPNSNYLATGSSDCSVRLWSVSTGRVLRVFTDCNHPVTQISFSPDGKYIAAAEEGKTVRIFDLAAGNQFVELIDHSSFITNISWIARGKLLSACVDGSVRLWDITKSDDKNSKIMSHKLLYGMNNGNRCINLIFNTLDKISLIVANHE